MMVRGVLFTFKDEASPSPPPGLGWVLSVVAGRSFPEPSALSPVFLVVYTWALIRQLAQAAGRGRVCLWLKAMTCLGHPMFPHWALEDSV